MDSGKKSVNTYRKEKKIAFLSGFQTKSFIYSYVGIFCLGNMHEMFGTLSALAEPNRFHIVELLRERPLPVGEIAEKLKIRQPQVSKHLHVLSKAGLVKAEPFAQQRIYKLSPKPLKDLDSWLESYKELWEENFDRLDDYLARLKAEEKKNAKRKRINKHG